MFELYRRWSTLWSLAGVDTLDPEQRVEAVRLNRILALGPAPALVFAVCWWMSGSLALALISLGTLVVCVGVRLALLGQPHLYALGQSWGLGAVVLLTVGGAMVSGQGQSPIAPFLIVFPAVFAYGARPWGGLIWTLISLSSLAGLFLAQVQFPVAPLIEVPPFVAAVHMVVAASLTALIGLSARREFSDSVEGLKRARDRALETADAKTDFLARVSHEIRTPLHQIVGMTDTLRTSELSREQHEAIEIIERSGASLVELVNQVLDLNKLESDHFDLNVASFDPLEVVEDVLEVVARQAQQKGLLLSWEAPLDFPARAIGDRMRVRQILLNLVGNAVKFTERGAVTVSMWADEGLQVEVTDTGIGIDAAHLEHLFQPYRQADETTSANFGGTGLGLAVSRRLARRMGGEIHVVSTPDEHTTFSLTIPVVFEEVVVEPPELVLCLLDDPPEPTVVAAAVHLGIAIVEDPVEGAWVVLSDATQVEELRSVWPQSHFAVLRDLGEAPAVEADANLWVPVRRSVLRGLGGARVTSRSPLWLGTVLVVDDNPVNRIVAERMLKSLGFDSVMATSGEEGVELANTVPFTAVLMDVLMPGMSGIEASRAILREVPILGLTASSTDEVHSSCLDAGMREVLTKPLRSETLAAALARLQTQSQAEAETDPGLGTAGPAGLDQDEPVEGDLADDADADGARRQPGDG